MSPKKALEPVQRTTALCYVRLSLTRDESDLNSPERQRTNIQAECERRGWTPEWYEDVDGHKSGTKEDNRPGWLALRHCKQISNAAILREWNTKQQKNKLQVYGRNMKR
jgi:hypothetical protein